MAHKKADKKPSKNLTLNPDLVEATEGYIEPRRKSFTSFVEEAVEEKLRALGIDPFAKKANPAASMGMTLAGSRC